MEIPIQIHIFALKKSKYGMKTLYEVKSRLQQISSQFSSDCIPIEVDGKEIDDIVIGTRQDDKYYIKITTKN